MLKLFYGAQISNFYIFLADFSFDFKHIVLSRLDELLGLTYMVGNLDV
jgi:hypothetical protein